MLGPNLQMVSETVLRYKVTPDSYVQKEIRQENDKVVASRLTLSCFLIVCIIPSRYFEESLQEKAFYHHLSIR